MPIMRSPKDTADKMAHLITGKVFCDLGSAGGVVVTGAMKYASRAFGIERNVISVEGSRKKGMDVIQGDVLTMELPEADVYYCWITHDTQREMVKRWRDGKIYGTLVIGSESHVPDEEKAFDDCNPETVIAWDYDEGEGHRERGQFRLGIFYAGKHNETT